ncbi:CDP-glycerol glycerophosphotransferase family protein [Halomicrobium sp. LC1Hm]|uniref:CDP-glycerol glycerophosphotransferase family protein n=1 Tax=Halomicrobium sp. LC1Hm TaxID=2610902 RepID=UPI001885B435|nr:CDP-glycerol glycerophosphotransferase family protein [Halomicrobium sp. LC1Hm]
MRIYTYLVGRDSQIWVFSDFYSGQEFSQNKRYLFQYLSKENPGEDRPIWLTRSSELYERLLDEGYEVYKLNSIKGRYYILRAKYIPIDAGPGLFPWWLTGGANIIQMGHGIPLKASADSNTNWLHRLVSWKTPDYGVFSSEHERNHFNQYDSEAKARAWLDHRLDRDTHTIYTGYPKTDAIVSPAFDTIDGIDVVPEKLDIKESDVVIGYFPTLREGHGLNIDEVFDVERTEEFLQQNDAKLLIKPHRDLDTDTCILESNLIELIQPDTDSHQFLAEIDILITDYSSIYFDFLLLDRPIIFYTPDYTDYTRIRGVHPNYDNVIAGPRVNNFEELLKQLESIVNGTDEFAHRRQEIRNHFFKYADGNACERIVKSIKNT